MGFNYQSRKNPFYFVLPQGALIIAFIAFHFFIVLILFLAPATTIAEVTNHHFVAIGTSKLKLFIIVIFIAITFIIYFCFSAVSTDQVIIFVLAIMANSIFLLKAKG